MPDNYDENADPDQDYRSLGDNFAFVPGKHVTILDKEALGLAEAASKKEKKKKILTPAQKKEAREMKKRKSLFDNTTRWLPDSSFFTYLGRSPWHAYGKGNTKPTYGGLNYGQNLLSHSINAECGDKCPQFPQTYPNALAKGLEQTKGLRLAEIPRSKVPAVLTEEELEFMRTRMPILAKNRRPLTAKDGNKDIKVSTGIRSIIKMSKPAMDLTGFKHTDKMIDKKK